MKLLFAILLASVLMTACGQKGDLYIPAAPEANQQAQSDADTAKKAQEKSEQTEQ
ncbi:lipoprotein [Shewanella sp. WXL01]|uniref:LPS translocon maturation chaperone LptM n=1 Tax=Shewanella sp. WXL01 TaxID=2709721 RepID=UPI001AEBBD66|nr:lipoprotein [Shewanella sp. WXL01]